MSLKPRGVAGKNRMDLGLQLRAKSASEIAAQIRIGEGKRESSLGPI